MSSIAVWKSASGYQLGSARPACRNCQHCDTQHAERMPPFDTVNWRCQLGEFFTKPMAVCDKHQPKYAPRRV